MNSFKICHSARTWIFGKKIWTGQEDDSLRVPQRVALNISLLNTVNERVHTVLSTSERAASCRETQRAGGVSVGIWMNFADPYNISLSKTGAPTYSTP